jgi:hypothetical protein
MNKIPLALLMFNVRVETGQILFIASVIAIVKLVQRIALPIPESGRRLAPYGIGSIAAFWTIERVASFVWFSRIEPLIRALYCAFNLRWISAARLQVFLSR